MAEYLYLYFRKSVDEEKVMVERGEGVVPTVCLCMKD